VKVEHAEYPSLIHDFYIMADVSPAVGEAVRATAASLKAALA
jgi:acetyl esterase